MSTSPTNVLEARANDVQVEDDALIVDLVDGRTLMVPLAWYPRLLHATPDERSNWRLIGEGSGIHWSDVDEDISVKGLLQGTPSNERPESLRKWLAERRQKA